MPVSVTWLTCPAKAAKKEYCCLTGKLCKYALKINIKLEECPFDDIQLIKEVDLENEKV